MGCEKVRTWIGKIRSSIISPSGFNWKGKKIGRFFLLNLIILRFRKRVLRA